VTTYTRIEETTTLIKFIIPASFGFGACWSEVMKAIHAAHNELWEQGRVPQGEDASDDVIRFITGDEEIIVFYERTVP
jgi:hypothetical protein